MDKAAIIGMYEFIGFHLCKKLLDEGYEVKGIHLPLKEQELYIEEKNLEIGRNANFTELNISDWQDEKVKGNCFLFINYYDLFMRNLDEQLLLQLKARKLSNFEKIIILLPQSMMVKQIFHIQRKQFNEWFHSLDQEKIMRIYLPTVYGPWQGMEFSFQQRLLDKKASIISNEREWRGDAIDVIDTIEHILLCLQSNHSEIVFRSDENGWEKCAQYLSIPYEKQQEDRHIAVYEHIIEPKRDIKENLNRQQKINQLFYNR